jgi:L-ascorbate metabolism protein UlaG (beta-lactamase superfamily)
MLRRLLKGLGAILLFVVVALSFAPTLVPPFLDRIYYEGPVSDHFDGHRFFNPGAHDPPRLDTSRILNRWLNTERPAWPDSVPVQPSLPPRNVAGEEMRVTWIGHSTVLVQVAGLNILTDPIWSERASPFSFMGPRRVRAPGVRFEDLPHIDLVLVSHNHWDHMDLPTLKRLWARDRPLIVTSLGNDTILRGDGIESVARDWGGRVTLPGGGEVVVLRNQHWGSRWGTDRNRALWSAFAVHTPHGNIFFGGDTGWGDGSWVTEAARAGPYRLAIIPIGAYLPRDFMQASHVGPDEALRIFDRLAPTRALAVHWGTFQLGFESIDGAPQALAALEHQRNMARDRFFATEVGRPFSVPER